MPHDPVLIDDTRAWLERAKLDLDAAVIDLAAERPLTGDAMFHAQQGAEKALKGFLTWHETPFRKTHDLRELFEACEAIDASFHDLGQKAASLTPFAWVFRYPGETADPPVGEAEEALALGRAVYDAVRERIPREDFPDNRAGYGGSGRGT